jgi:hypothetical protein
MCRRGENRPGANGELYAFLRDEKRRRRKCINVWRDEADYQVWLRLVRQAAQSNDVANISNENTADDVATTDG